MGTKARSEGDRNAEERKEALIAGLGDVRARILSLASTMPAERRAQTFLGAWSVKELLAHLAGWDGTNVKAAEEILAGELPGFYQHSDKDWASYNAMLVAEYGMQDFEALLESVKATHARLLAFIEGVPASEIWKDRGIRARGWKVTIGRLLEVERDDEEEHFHQLKQFVEAEETTKE